MSKFDYGDKVKVGHEKIHADSCQGEYGMFLSYEKIHVFTYAKIMLNTGETVLVDPRELVAVDRTIK